MDTVHCIHTDVIYIYVYIYTHIATPFRKGRKRVPTSEQPSDVIHNCERLHTLQYLCGTCRLF